jgi:hypothetical protein
MDAAIFFGIFTIIIKKDKTKYDIPKVEKDRKPI